MRFSESRVTDGYELLDVGAGNQTQVLWKQPVLLTAKPSLSPLILFLEDNYCVFLPVWVCVCMSEDNGSSLSRGSLFCQSTLWDLGTELTASE